MAALTRAGAGMQLAIYLGVAALLVLAATVCLLVLLLASSVAYVALCMGLKVAAALIFGLGALPMAGLVLLATAFWQEDRKRRMQQAFGGPAL